MPDRTAASAWVRNPFQRIQPLPRAPLLRKASAMYFLLRVGILLLVCAGGVGCSGQEDARFVDWNKRAPVALPRQEPAITYAYLPQYTHAVSFERHRRILEYLRQATGLPFRQVFPATFAEHMAMVERGDIDISFTNPFVYVLLHHRAGAQVFARAVEEEGGADFQGQVIVRADNAAITTLEDCRGKTWIAVEPTSAGGYLFPLALFHEHGITLDQFARVEFARGVGGKQEQVVLAVLSGAYDIGSIRKGTLDIVARRYDTSAIRVLAETPPYPGWLFCARKDLSPEVTQQVAQALTALRRPKDESILAPAGLTAIIPASHADYRPIEKLMHTLGMETVP